MVDLRVFWVEVATSSGMGFGKLTRVTSGGNLPPLEVIMSRLWPAVSHRWPQGLRHRVTDAFWLLDATRMAPRQRAKTEAAVDAAARVALCASCQVVSASAQHRRQTPRGVRYPAGHRADAGEIRLDHQYRVCRKAEPGHPPMRRRDRASGQHAVSGRSGLTGSAGAVSRVSQPWL